MSVPAAASPQIFLLEDEPLSALDIETVLEDAGLTVITIGSCKQSLKWLKTHKPALAILDVELTDGPCSSVAEVLARENVPFIVHTGNVQSLNEDTPFHWGTWLSKPSRPEDFLNEVKVHLGRDTA